MPGIDLIHRTMKPGNGTSITESSFKKLAICDAFAQIYVCLAAGNWDGNVAMVLDYRLSQALVDLTILHLRLSERIAAPRKKHGDRQSDGFRAVWPQMLALAKG